MRILAIHCRKTVLRIIFSVLLVCPHVVLAQSLNDIIDVSYITPKKNVTLRYSKVKESDRFVFEFSRNNKVPYEIKSDTKSTTITFYGIFDITTQNLTEFDNYKNILQKKLSNRSLEITFPLPLASSFEHLNSVILDLNTSIEKQRDKIQQTVKPLQISSLSFSWNIPVALSVFKRGKYLWIVFNHYQQVNTDELIKNAGRMVKDIIQLPHTSATILRVEAVDEIFSEVRKEGLLWVVDLYNRKTDRDVKPIKVTVDTSTPNKPYIQATLPRTEEVFSFLDPEIGDMLMAITSSEAGYAFLDGYKYPDFQFLPTSQGMAVNSDDFGIGIIRNLEGFVLQTTQHPLNVSKDLEQLKQRAEDAKRSGVDITKDLTVPILYKTFAQSEKFLNMQIKIAPKVDKNKFSIELIRFYLSHGLGSNAMHFLRKVEARYVEVDKEVPIQVKTLKAVAAFLMKRYNLAFELLNRPELTNNAEVALWKSLADTSEERDNTPEIMKNIQYIHSYPTAVKRSLAMRGVEYALQKENDELVQRFLNILREVPQDGELKTFISYNDAEKIKLQGYMRSALPEYRIAALGSSEKYSALARFRIAEFNSQVADAKLNMTIKELERLKFAWGEKDFKIRVLNKLVDLYLKSSNYYMALKTLNEISYLSADTKKDVEQRMIEIMEEIFYYNNDNQFSPIKALALFDDFGYLMKKSTKQTAITLKLADRLVAIDLLDRAYTLLTDYMRINQNTLSDTEKSAMGSRLALINLFNNEESEAIRNLDETEFYDIPQTLALQRKIIRAHALTKMGEIQQALDLLKDNNSKNAILLRAQIYWDAEDWDKASDTIRLLIQKPEEGKPISDEQIHFVLDWLTALKQAKKETVIVRVKNTFLPYFQNTQYSGMFNLLTNVLESDEVNITDISKTIQDVKSFSDFTKQYTKSLIDDNLAENNGL